MTDDASKVAGHSKPRITAAVYDRSSLEAHRRFAVARGRETGRERHGERVGTTDSNRNKFVLFVVKDFLTIRRHHASARPNIPMPRHGATGAHGSAKPDLPTARAGCRSGTNSCSPWLSKFWSLASDSRKSSGRTKASSSRLPLIPAMPSSELGLPPAPGVAAPRSPVL